jgi:beta-galactosidase
VKTRTLSVGLFAISVIGAAPLGAADSSPRDVLSLDGTWQIAEGRMDQAPATFEHTVPVPGLASLATPPFASPPGPRVARRDNLQQKDPARDAFWYRRTFRLDQTVPAVARLKVTKAMFGSQAILNGHLLGGHAGSFTPAYYDAKAALRPGENVLLIRVGADRDAVTQAVPAGFDFEKERYIPGIFDSVELILSGTPHILSVQAAPDIAAQTVRVRAVLRNDGESARVAVEFVVREAKSGRVAGRVKSEAAAVAPGAETTVDVRIPVANCHLWSPEDPFLYRLDADSGADRLQTRFGMREFRFDQAAGHAVLNGQPYFMRGSNFTLYRFFEDDDCKALPWTESWVRLLHQRVKDMHWNCLRYCIGFPPEAWYDIADEKGILIQDEFPVWTMNLPAPKSGELEKEFAEWMPERWNHPCVVIWDAQNETRSAETGAALAAVRGLDLSGRPWDNGWGLVQADSDSLEMHVYHFSIWNANARFTLADLARADRTPLGGLPSYDGRHAIILNEYAWLWLNRDGSPTTLTGDIYRNLLGENSTVAQRRHLYATYLAAETEFWRSYRKAAAVMHFTTLGYSRADGQTSDHWEDIPSLRWEPEFHRYVRDAFAPVGLMVEFWSDTVLGGRSAHIPVRLINDLSGPWSGEVALRLSRGGTGAPLVERRQEGRLDPYGQATVGFDFTWPAQSGPCVLEASLRGADGEQIRSVREIVIGEAGEQGLALGRVATASSSGSPADGPGCAVDGDPATVWASAGSDGPSWLAVDLGEARRIGRIRVSWGFQYAMVFSVETSPDGQAWSGVHSENEFQGGVSDIRFAPREARFVRVHCFKRPRDLGDSIPPEYSIRELQVFE